MKAIITGVTGQDGSYLAELLVEKGYDVVGIARRSSTDNRQRLRGLKDKPNFRVVEGDVGDPISMDGIIRDNPDVDEVYNLAAQSHVGTSFKQPVYTWDVNAKGPVYIMDAITNYAPHARFYQASTSELFGNNFSVVAEPFGIKVPVVSCKNVQCFQNETTHFDPQSPYAVAKRDAHDMVKIYRERGLWACAGILFNHESPRRGSEFVTRKVTQWLGKFRPWWYEARLKEEISAAIPYIQCEKSGEKFPKLRLGNLEACRDWGYAPDYVYGMWLMMQQDKPRDFVLATGETHGVEEFVEEAFHAAGIRQWRRYIYIDPEFYRPCEVNFLHGDASLARKVLGWEPSVTFKELVRIMVNADRPNECLSTR